MKRAIKGLIFALAGYILLWAFTWQMQPSQYLRAHIQKTEDHAPTDHQFDAFIAVAPFLVRVEWRWGWGNLGQHGMEGLFFWTPFGSYTISKKATWIS